MKITMLSPTYWDGKRLKPGDTVEMPEGIGARWVKAGIAADGSPAPPGEPKKKTSAKKE